MAELSSPQDLSHGGSGKRNKKHRKHCPKQQEAAGAQVLPVACENKQSLAGVKQQQLKHPITNVALEEGKQQNPIACCTMVANLACSNTSHAISNAGIIAKDNLGTVGSDELLTAVTDNQPNTFLIACKTCNEREAVDEKQSTAIQDKQRMANNDKLADKHVVALLDSQTVVDKHKASATTVLKQPVASSCKQSDIKKDTKVVAHLEQHTDANTETNDDKVNPLGRSVVSNDQSLSHHIRGPQQLGSSIMNGGSNNAETQLDNSCQSKPKLERPSVVKIPSTVKSVDSKQGLQASSKLSSQNQTKAMNQSAKGTKVTDVPELHKESADAPMTGPECVSVVEPTLKSKAELKNERRAIQEAQRAAKASGLKVDKKTVSLTTPVSKQGQSNNARPKDGTKVTECQDVKLEQDIRKTVSASRQNLQDRRGSGSTRADVVPPKDSGVISARLRVPDHVQADDERAVKRLTKKLERLHVPNRTTEKQRKVGLFQHLHQYERDVPLTKDIQFASGSIHPAIVRLGLQYADGLVCGSNARCVALLLAMKQVIADYHTPEHTELARDLQVHIRPCISFLTQCRPLSVSMGNAIRHLKNHIARTPSHYSDDEAKAKLYDEIDVFLKERIILAAKDISVSACTKIHDGNVILVYGCSSLIRTVLCTAHDIGKKFTVIVVDGRPKFEGREMVRRLASHGISCSYILINELSNSIRQVTTVMLGAHALLANGYMMSRVGTSQVAQIASLHNIPVIVCCETYKFCERVQTDSFVHNELGDPDDLVTTNIKSCDSLTPWHDVSKLRLLNLLYDVTPMQLMSMVITDITDFGLVPMTSVPVVIRVKNSDS